jgi:hypothetical protein
MAVADIETNLYGYFTNAGIWKWNGSTWSQVTPNNPQLMAFFGTTLYGSFKGGGVWEWDGTKRTKEPLRKRGNNHKHIKHKVPV